MTTNVPLIILLCAFSFVCSSELGRRHEAIDSSFIDNALDAEECDRQMEFVINNQTLLLQFTDSGVRTPRGILAGNLVDLGNYHQCLDINHKLEDMHIEGKYCSILVPFNQMFDSPRPEDMRTTQFDPSSLRLDNETISKIAEYHQTRAELLALSGNFDGFKRDTRSNNSLASTVFRLGVCVPKPCTTHQAITSFFFNTTEVDFQFREDYCRLPGDKPWAPADYTAVAVFSMLGFVTLISTSYDLCYRFLFKKDVKQMSTLCRSFSVYTNGQRLTTFSSGGANLQCLDGIRTIAMLWVIVGHSFTTEPFIQNNIDFRTWIFSANALWISAAPMTVDTFFTIGGVLLVYTTAGKMNQITFIKNLHWFYLNRFMRVTPLLAATVLLQTSYFNHITDGPYWQSVIENVEKCRHTWWSTLLHIQNWLDFDDLCMSHSWYIAIDFQLYVVSPLVLVWVMTGKKYLAWIGVVGGLAAVLIGSTIYSFHLNLQAGMVVPSRILSAMDYLNKYYFNTLTRASPFFVGLLFGYILHLYRKNRIQIPWILAIFFWACSAGAFGGILYFHYRIKQFDWDNQLMDNLMNSFMRPVFACTICWLIVACQHGYAGPVNWFLSLDAWRLPARLSYGMFLLHYPLMFSLNSAMVAPIYFSVSKFTYKFLTYVVLALVYSFVFTLLVDSPVTVLFKLLMDSAKKTKPAVKATENLKEDKNGDVKDDLKNTKDANAGVEVNIISEKLDEPKNLKTDSNGDLEKSGSNEIARNDFKEDENVVVNNDSDVLNSKSVPEIR